MGIIRKGIIGKILYWGLIAYASAYLVGTGAASVDYWTSHKKWLDQHVKNELVIKDVSMTLDDKVRKMTMVGETHIYNRRESEFARDFIDSYNLILYEGHDPSIPYSFLTKAYRLMLAPIAMPAFEFYSYGSGRFFSNRTLEDLALELGLEVRYLENKTDGGIGELSIRQKTELFGLLAVDSVRGPLLYFETKGSIQNPQEVNLEATDYAWRLVDGDKRDRQMADEIMGYLRDSDPHKKVLIVVGKGHVDGILAHIE